MFVISKKHSLQLKVFAPAILLLMGGFVFMLMYWHKPPFPPQLFNGPALLYIGLVYLAAPGPLVLAVATGGRNFSLRTLRWIGVGYIVAAFMTFASTAEKILYGQL